MAQQLEQQILLTLNPVVHRIAGDQLGLFYLIEHVELQLRIDVAEEDVFGVAEFFRDAGLKVGEDTETGLERFAAVQIVRISGFPAERLALLPFHTRQVDAARRQFLEMIFGKVAPDHADDLDGSQHRARHRKEHRGSAERVGSLAEGRDDGIQRDRADDEYTHAHIRSGARIPKSERPFASTCLTARASTSRAASSGSPNTRYL